MTIAIIGAGGLSGTIGKTWRKAGHEVLFSSRPAALHVAEQLVCPAGCDPVIVADLPAARRFQRGGAGFRAPLDAPALRRALALQ